MNGYKEIYDSLLEAYGPQGWWPLIIRREEKGFDQDGYHKGDYSYPRNEGDRFEILQGAILTQNTSWQNVVKSIEVLREKDVMSAENVEALPEKKLASLIKSSGYFNQKAKKIKKFITFYCSLRGRTPSREELLAVWGVGPETADSILLYAYKQPVFVVDAYTKRIFSRIGLCREKASYDELQKLFHEKLEKKHELYNEYHALLVEHAKRYCRKKPLCAECPLLAYCKYGRFK